MAEQVDKKSEWLQQQITVWIEEFSRSHRFGSLTAKQKRGFEQIVTLFILTMYSAFGRLPNKWTVRSVEGCCQEVLPGILSESLLLVMPPVLAFFLAYLEEAGHIKNGIALIRAVNRVQEKKIHRISEIDVKSWKSAPLDSFGIEVGSENSLQALRQFAAHIAKEIGKDRPALISREVMESFEQHPLLIFDILPLLKEQFAVQVSGDDDLLTAYFLLLTYSLQHVRFGIERHFDWAKEIVQEFQLQVIEQAKEENFSPQFLVGILESITEAKLEISKELLEVYEYQITNFSPPMEVPTRVEIDSMFTSLVEEHQGEPFAIHDTLAQMTHALPADAQSALIGEFAYSNLPGMKDAVVILCLHADETVRHEALQWLLGNAQFMTPTALRRLIVIRNWLPNRERKVLDALIKAARLKGVECAQCEPGAAIQALQFSQMDGVGAQSALLSMALETGKFRIGAMLFKQNTGLADAWVTPLTTKQEVLSTLRQAGKRELFLEVSSDYLRASVRHNIAVSLELGNPPAVGLLQLAESIAATEWVPERFDFSAWIEQLSGGEQSWDKDAQFVERIMQTSGDWGNLPKITGSWFEESQEVATFFEQTRIRNMDRLIRQVLERFCEPNREIWAERMAWTAFWLHEQTAKVQKMVGLDLNFTLMARELYRGRPLWELPLMRSIAYRTITGLSGWS